MKLKTLALVATVTTLSASAAHAEHNWNWNTNERFAYERDQGPKFNSNEFTVDLFGSYKRAEKNVGDFFDEPEHGVWGGGLGANYFFTRMLGIGADASAHDDGRQFIDNASASLIFRIPIESLSLAPYIFGGGGRNFDPRGEWEGHAGVGLEFRLNPHTGIFADGRYVWPDKTGDASLIRTGLRFAF